jgi:oligoendopeptidase F
MNAPFKTSADPLDAPLWDLSDLYASREDARIQADLERTRALVNELNGLQGRLAAAQDEPETLGRRLDQAITLYEQASDILGGLGAYAFLAASTNRNDAGAQGFEATVREKLTAIATPTIWVTLEINQLDDAAVEAGDLPGRARPDQRPVAASVRRDAGGDEGQGRQG